MVSQAANNLEGFTEHVAPSLRQGSAANPCLRPFGAHGHQFGCSDWKHCGRFVICTFYYVLIPTDNDVFPEGRLTRSTEGTCK